MPAVILLTALTCSCIGENRSAVPEGLPVTLDLDFGPDYRVTRSILKDPDIENKLTGMLVLLYRSSDGRLDKSFVLEGNSGRITLLSGIGYDIFFLANIEDPSEIDVPEYESSLANLSYRIPSFESLKRTGIPSCANLTNVNITNDSKYRVELTRLLAKVKVHVSHRGITGADVNDASKFANLKLYVRQANSRLLPFNDGGSVALSESDLLEQSDYEPQMSRDGEDFVLYVPENIQGRLLPNNLDPAMKNEDELRSLGIGTDCLTYIEYTGNLNPELSGYGGDLIYRFYLGGDNVGDFSIERNHIYEIGLGLTAENLFDPYWKVSRGENWNDRRTIRMLGADGSVLTEGASIVARPSKPGKLTLFLNTDGSSNNMIAKSFCCAYNSDNTGNAALYWTSNIKSSDQHTLTLPADIRYAGVEMAFDKASGTFTFSIYDETKVGDGAEFELEFLLKPGEEYHRCTVKLKVLPDCSIDIPSDQMYVAQKMKVAVTGASGEYSAKIVSGSQYVDVDADELCVYGKKTGTAKIRLSSSDPVNDNQIDFTVTVNQLYVGFFVDAPSYGLDCDGTDIKFPLFFCSDVYGRNRLDGLDFDPVYLKKYYASTVTHNSSVLPNISDFYEVDPYTMTAHIKRLVVDGVQLLDYYTEKLDVDMVTLSYPCGKSFTFSVGTILPFIQHDYNEGSINADALVVGSGGNSLDFTFVSYMDSKNLTWKYSGKMDVSIDELSHWEYRITLPYGEQKKFLAEDSGKQCVRGVLTNIHSGETIESTPHYFDIIGLFGAGLVLLPQGDKFADARIQLCWRDNFADVVAAGTVVSSISDYNQLGSICDYFYPEGSFGNGTGESGFRLGDYYDVPDIRTSDLTIDDIRTFISGNTVFVNQSPESNYSLKYGGCYLQRRKSCFVKLAKSNVSGNWMGAYVPAGQSSGWVEFF